MSASTLLRRSLSITVAGAVTVAWLRTELEPEPATTFVLTS